MPLSVDTLSISGRNRARIELELESGETLLWIGRPDRQLAIRSKGWEPLYFIIFGALFAAFGLIVWSGPGLYHATFFFAAGAGVALLGFNLYVEEWSAIYFITDRRAAILKPSLAAQVVRSLRPHADSRVTADPNECGVGDLYFCGHESNDDGSTESFVFTAIDSVEEAKRIAESVIASSFPRSGAFPEATPVDLSRLPRRLKARIDRTLDSGEFVTWLSLPNAKTFGRRFRGMQFFSAAALLFILWMGVIPEWLELIGPNGRGDYRMLTLMAPILLFLIALFLSPYWGRIISRYCAYYTTNRRVVSIDCNVGFGPIGVRYYSAADLRLIERIEYRDGNGHLLLRSEVAIHGGEDHQRLSTKLGFYGMPDVRAAERALVRWAAAK